jgi:transposase-like protein
VPAQPSRRRFPAEYKLRVLQEADRARQPGEIGALLRREGLYSSQLALWRRQREQGQLAGLGGRKRGRKARALDPRVKQLERENARLRRQLQRAELLLELQKKASEILGIPLRSLEEENEGHD